MRLRMRTRRYIFVSIVTGLAGTILWMNWPKQATSGPTPAGMTSSGESRPTLGTDALSTSAAQPEPDVSNEQPKAADPAKEPPPKVRSYSVADGDTVEAIARRFGLQPSTILVNNPITDETLLQVGQSLQIPATDGLLYTVAEGDTFWDIANAYQAEVDEIIRSNPDVTPDSLQPGQRLLVPGAERPRRTNMVASRGDAAPRPAPPSETATELQWPLRGEITESFGWRVHPVYGTRNYHEGIDIGVPEGTPVAAAAAGTVVLSEWYGGYGLTVKVDHGNGLVTRYSHNGALLAKPGETVAKGQVIARSGNTGVSTGPHLDFGIYRQGQPVDPLDFLPRQ